MAISEQLQNRIANLTGSMDPGFSVSPPPMSPEQQAMAKRMGEQFGVTPENMQPMTPEQKEYMGRMSVSPTDMMMRPSMQVPPQDAMQRGAVSDQEVGMYLDSATEDMSEEDRQRLEMMLKQGTVKSAAPLAEIAEQIKAAGTGEDTQLAHLRPGEMVIPPEFLEDEQFESMLEKKYNEFNINPEQAVVGAGIASLNATTGLEEFGFFKKIGKSLKKVAKKIAPVAGPLANLIPGVGPLVAGAIGAATNVVGGGGLKGAISGALGGYGTGKALSGIGSLGKVGGKLVGQGNFSALGFGDKLGALKSGLTSGNLASTFFNPAAGDKGMFGGSIGPSIRSGLGSLTGFGQPQTYDTSEAIGTLNGKPITRADLANMTPDQIGQMQMTQAAANDKTLMQRLSAKFLPQGVENMLGTGPGGGGLGGLLGGGAGGGGGLGGLLGMAGAGALAAKLGKLAFDETKGMTGVPLTPLTTMDASGRYNIEAEIARRMGQDAPNPVEFGLLPAGTFPELSGGKPQGMMYGGSVMPMAYAEGGNVAVEDFERMNGGISGPGTETSDDVPAMLSDGEFVMTGKAVRGAGGFNMDNNGGIITLTPSGEEDRNKGTDLMYEMMGLFESYGTA
jgi:hypothetical protein